MKKTILFFFLLLFPFLSGAQEKVSAVLFYAPHCKACLEFKEEFLPQIKERYADKVLWSERNVEEDEQALSLLISLSRHFKNDQARYPSVFVGNILLVGRPQIESEIGASIDIALRRNSVLPLFENKDLKQIFRKLSVFTVLGSGLIDGVNPCAFAVIVFFVSFLSAYGYSRRQMLCVGIFYCLAVFIAYTLIGAGLFKFLYALRGVYYVIKMFYYLTAFLCFTLAGLSLYDYFKLKKTGYSAGMVLQLPSFLKKKINALIGSGLRQKRERSARELSAIAFVVGFGVSLLEAVCTGQVYLPTIVFILKDTELRLKAFLYLVLYNLMFITPLIAVFLLSFFGIRSHKFNEFLKSNVGRIKIITAALFMVLGFFILWYG